MIDQATYQQANAKRVAVAKVIAAAETARSINHLDTGGDTLKGCQVQITAKNFGPSLYTCFHCEAWRRGNTYRAKGSTFCWEAITAMDPGL